MKSLSVKCSIIKYLCVNAVFGLMFFASILSVSGQTTTFAQFSQALGGQDFKFTNQTSSGNFTATTPVDFKYFNISGLPAALQGFQSANLIITTNTTSPGTVAGGTVSQPLNQTVTVQIIRTTPAPIGTGSGARTNLLTAVFSPNTNTPAIVGANNGNSATLSATTPDHNVVFTSDFVSFGLTTQRNLGLSFSSVSPSLALGAGNFLQTFDAAGTGTFASNPPPVYAPPTAANAVVRGQVFTSAGQGLRNAQVVLTQADGTVYKTVTGSFGQFEFPEITGGQTVVVSVISKRFSFGSQIINVQENVSEVNFFANE